MKYSQRQLRNTKEYKTNFHLSLRLLANAPENQFQIFFRRTLFQLTMERSRTRSIYLHLSRRANATPIRFHSPPPRSRGRKRKKSIAYGKQHAYGSRINCSRRCTRARNNNAITSREWSRYFTPVIFMRRETVFPYDVSRDGDSPHKKAARSRSPIHFRACSACPTDRQTDRPLPYKVISIRPRSTSPVSAAGVSFINKQVAGLPSGSEKNNPGAWPTEKSTTLAHPARPAAIRSRRLPVPSFIYNRRENHRRR